MPGLVSHITQRAAGKEPLFVEEADYLDMIRLLNEAAKKHTLTIKPVSEEKNAVEVFLAGLAKQIPRLWEWLHQRGRSVDRGATALQPSDRLEERIAELRRDGFGRRPGSRAALRHLIERLISRGYRREEIAQRLGVSRKTVYNLLSS